MHRYEVCFGIMIRFNVNFDVKKVLVCCLSIGLYFSKSKLGHFIFWALKHKYLARRTLRH